MSTIIVDGVKVYDEAVVYFDDWLNANGYSTKDELKDSFAEEGFSEDEIEEKIDILFDEFCEWAEDNELIPMPI